MKLLCMLMVFGCNSIWLLAAENVNNQLTASGAIAKHPTTPNPILNENATQQPTTNDTSTEGPNGNSTSTIKHPPISGSTAAPPINQYDQKHKMMLVLMSDVKLREYGKPQLGYAATNNNKKNSKDAKDAKEKDQSCEDQVAATAAPAAEIENNNEANCSTSSTTPAPTDMNCDESRRDEQIIEAFPAKVIHFSEPIACETLSKDDSLLHHAHDVNCYFPAPNPVWYRMYRKRARNQRRNLRLKELLATFRKPRPYMYDYDYMDHYDEAPWRNYDSKEDAYYSAL